MKLSDISIDAMLSGLITNLWNATNLSRLAIYSGEPPVVDGNFLYNDGNTTTYFAQRLALFTIGSQLQNVNHVLRFGTSPAAVNAGGTGTATWFAIYPQPTTSPANINYSLLGSISDQADGSGVLILQSTALVSGQPVNAIELGLRLF